MTMPVSDAQHPPPDAAGAPEGAPIQTTPTKRITPNSSGARFEFGAHNRWYCCSTDRVPEPCPRCCRCSSRQDCPHPAHAPAELVGAN